MALEWSPDGRLVMASTVAPRLRVDNGVQVRRAAETGPLLMGCCDWDGLLMGLG